MKTVLPQGTGPIEWGGVPIAVILAIAAVIAFCGCLWAWDCHQIRNRRPTKSEPCEEDKALDALGVAVDRKMEEQDRRRSRRAVPITDPSLDPIQTMNINRRARRLGTDSGGWPT